MRLILVLGAVLLAVVAIVIAWRLQPGPPATTRLAGVSISAGSPSLVELPNGKHRLALPVVVRSDRALEDCLAFALDNPFRDRVLHVDGSTGCVRPAVGLETASLTFDGLTDDDVLFASHALLWGVAGGRCGPILGLFGICSIDPAGSVPITLPVRQVVPTLGPIGSLVPVFSLPPELEPSQ